MTNYSDIKYNRSLLDIDHDIGEFEITREMVIAFSKAVGETDPKHIGDNTGEGDIVAPATFCNIFMAGVNRPNLKLDFGNTTLFAGQSLECGRKIRPGDNLKATTRLSKVYSKTGRSGKMVFAIWETTFRNRNDETVTKIFDSFVTREISDKQR